jgi:hypothetical protein
MPEDARAYFQRKYEDRMGEREQARQARAQNLAAAVPEPGAPPTRSFGFQSGAARGLAEGRNADLAVAGAELGAPTSYAGGAGAPPSIGVIRGMKQTYAQDTGGPQLQEFATPQQAGQAWNRNQLNQDLALARQTPGVTPNVAALEDRYGKYVPPKGPEAEVIGEQQRLTQAAENKRPDLVMKAKVDEETYKRGVSELVGKDFESDFLKRWSPRDSAGKLSPVTDPVLLRDKDDAKSYAMEQGNVQAGQKYVEWSQRLRQMRPDAYKLAAQNPLAWSDFVKIAGPQLSPAIANQANTGAPAVKASNPLALQNIIGRGLSAGASNEFYP